MDETFEQHLERQEAGCLHFLRSLHDSRNLTEEQCQDLHDMVLMVSALGRGVEEREFTYTRSYAHEIRRLCRRLRHDVARRAAMACTASDRLPRLILRSDAHLRDGIEEWTAILKTLQGPDDAASACCGLISQYLNRIAYEPLLALFYLDDEPETGVLDEIDDLGAVCKALATLNELSRDVDALVQQLHEELQWHRYRLTRSNGEGATPSRGLHGLSADISLNPQAEPSYTSEITATPPSSPSSAELARAAVTTVWPDAKLSKSFSAAEEALSRSNASLGYTTTRRSSETSIRSAPTPHRRKGMSVPRIIAGPFSRLEDSIRRLQLHRAQKADKLSRSESDDSVRVRDFATTPIDDSHESLALSPCSSLSPPSRRRETVLARDVDWETRAVQGVTVSLRRPSGKDRAQTSDGLDAWLRRSGRHRHVSDGTMAQRTQLRHREHTI